MPQEILKLMLINEAILQGTTISGEVTSSREGLSDNDAFASGRRSPKTLLY